MSQFQELLHACESVRIAGSGLLGFGLYYFRRPVVMGAWWAIMRLAGVSKADAGAAMLRAFDTELDVRRRPRFTIRRPSEAPSVVTAPADLRVVESLPVVVGEKDEAL